MEFHITCEIPLSAADMWRVRASAGFRRHVVEDGLLKKLDCTSVTRDKDGYSRRTQRYVPTKVDCPNFLRHIIGDTLFDVTDEQRWKDVEEDEDESAEYCQHFSIRPTHLANFCVTTGSLTLESIPDSSALNDNDIDLDNVSSDEEDVTEEDNLPNTTTHFPTLSPNDRSLHSISGMTKVNLPGAGWAVERSIIHNLRVFYSMYPTTIANFRKKLYDKFANGDQNVPTRVVIDRFLKHEEETESVSDDLSDGDGTNELSNSASGGNSLEFANIAMPSFDAPPPQQPRTAPRSIEEELEKFFVSV